jgi:hypothetical protein
MEAELKRNGKVTFEIWEQREALVLCLLLTDSWLECGCGSPNVTLSIRFIPVVP